jgi:serine/threonine protein kinase
MNQKSSLPDLIARWKAARDAGMSMAPEELCADCPELLPELLSALTHLQAGDSSRTVSAPDPHATLTYKMSAQSLEKKYPESHYLAGQDVAGFRLLRQIGKGGFGQVFEAEDLKLNRSVAVKFLLPEAHARPGVREQFLAEARSMAAIQHDHVVPIFQVGQVDSNLFLVMPLLVGETLAQRLKREGSLPPAEIRRIGRELCHGLAALHAKGLIHRDIKPANLWLEMTTGRLKVLDLGLADEAFNLRASSSGGTPAYMSPEQVEGADLDFRSDMFSVGAVLYECATGRRAFSGNRITEVLDAVRRAQPLPVQDVNPGVPSDLADLIHRLLHKDRTARPPSALAVAEALQPATSSIAPSAQAPQRTRLVATTAVLSIVGLVAVLLVLFNRPKEFSGPQSSETTNEPSASAALAVESLQVIPWKIEGDDLKEALPPLGARDHVLPTTADAIEVTAKLSRKAYSYIVLYRSDGKDYLLFPQDDTAVPPLTDQPRYPSTRPDVRYVLDDGPGIWAVAILASDNPLPNYREWRQKHPDQPWKPQSDPTRLKLALLDTGRDWRTLGNNRSYSRGERQFQVEPYQQQMDWLKRQVDKGAVMGVAFPVR